jgi:hypothetical protein
VCVLDALERCTPLRGHAGAKRSRGSGRTTRGRALPQEYCEAGYFVGMPRVGLIVSLAMLGAGVAGGIAGGASGIAATETCTGRVSVGVLPVWARGGFTEPEPRMPHAVGRSRAIAAIVFGYPLQVPPAATRNNKILWVARDRADHATPLRIRAQRMRGERKVGLPVSRVVKAGPGPSIINLPVAGCWRFVLAWGGKHDRLDLKYRAAR